MTLRQISCLLFSNIVLANISIAAQSAESISLQAQRERVVNRYIMDLKNADYRDIAQLFEKTGMVVSTSRGEVNAKDFFYAFLPSIVSAKTELHQSFLSSIDRNHYAARFHFSFKLKDGEQGDGEYIDEFIFTDKSAKLSAVYMFENLKFPTSNYPNR
jgi:hypothetical protein